VEAEVTATSALPAEKVQATVSEVTPESPASSASPEHSSEA